MCGKGAAGPRPPPTSLLNMNYSAACSDAGPCCGGASQNIHKQLETRLANSPGTPPVQSTSSSPVQGAPWKAGRAGPIVISETRPTRTPSLVTSRCSLRLNWDL
ncbi:hypothetical protein KIL84_021005 [Mauremys mutica]|uniref:Uncharacterized protein n=1 Tax=Mauremys mutica TaxID=74926 RepID=A0A9D3XAQ9_9SAUR|nr:hypothetical protein KIL84_021005 [Mauremys mutica]